LQLVFSFRLLFYLSERPFRYAPLSSGLDIVRKTLSQHEIECLERELDKVRDAAAGSSSGVFGPQSLTWQIAVESAAHCLA
jgi:hypothetical protein